jgi:hypothetical protein
VKQFQSSKELAHWLTARGIDLTQWGRDGAKTLENLWDEYASGEVAFHDDPPLRIVEVVQVLIRRGKHVLLEKEQEFGNAQRRSRNLPPSEKLKRGEHYIEAAVRCLNEELGLARDEIAFIGSAYEKVTHVRESPSYPGLRTQYTFHSIEAVAKGLPNRDFWRENAPFSGGDPVKRHLWAWQPRS